MTDLLLGSLLLSVIHVLIPNHWIPVVMVGKTEGWSQTQLLGVAAMTSFSHTLGTILLGIAIGLVGFELSGVFEKLTRIVSPLILVFMGIIYLIFFRNRQVHSHHPNPDQFRNKSNRAIILSLSLSMFFSPCIEIEVYFFTAGTVSKLAIWLVSVIYLIVTVVGTLLLVGWARKRIEKLNWQFLDHHEKKITGLVLIILGIVSYFVKQ